jgi:GT2 family glycosyltransferase
MRHMNVRADRDARCDVSVVLSTYNRADRLPSALDALLSQIGDVAYEVIVVDNNSTDATRTVVEHAAAGSDGRLRYVFEPRQGCLMGATQALQSHEVRSSPSPTTTCACRPIGSRS